MDIYKCGTSVKLKLVNIEGTITGVTIRFDAIAYEVSYFYNGEYRQIWVNECEFVVNVDVKKPIGFVN